VNGETGKCQEERTNPKSIVRRTKVAEVIIQESESLETPRRFKRVQQEDIIKGNQEAQLHMKPGAGRKRCGSVCAKQRRDWIDCVD
jgi:hypothetical protein